MHTAGYRYLLRQVDLITRLGLPIFYNMLTSTSTICNVLPLGLNATDIDFEKVTDNSAHRELHLSHHC